MARQRRRAACPRCATQNSRIEAVCLRCGKTLPWANRLEEAAKLVRKQSDQIPLGLTAMALPLGGLLLGMQMTTLPRVSYTLLPLTTGIAFCWFFPFFFNAVAFSMVRYEFLFDSRARLVLIRLALLVILLGAVGIFRGAPGFVR